MLETATSIMVSYFCAMKYDLPVRGDKVKHQQVTALHLFCGMAFIGTGAIIYVYNFSITWWGFALMVAGIVLATLTMVRNKVITRPGTNLVFRIAELLISLAVLALSVVEWWKFPVGIFGALSAAIIFAIYWERGAGQQLYINVDETGIRLPPTFRRRFIRWSEVEQVLLRHGILSVDCLDNKLYQASVSDITVSTSEFEAYCVAQIEAHVAERVKNDW
jgi:hypothetical protein